MSKLDLQHHTETRWVEPKFSKVGLIRPKQTSTDLMSIPVSWPNQTSSACSLSGTVGSYQQRPDSPASSEQPVCPRLELWLGLIWALTSGAVILPLLRLVHMNLS